ncbi:hypothetical protein NAS141_17594 [Sulfitobacter sp. NAS-14.1]|nr:hypothetical protein NAS141_17594 [Sulfitobacter sp. NAS-14.1]
MSPGEMCLPLFLRCSISRGGLEG